MNTFTLHPTCPFRLDYTAWALRRRAKNLIDNWDGKQYTRLLYIERAPILIMAEQEKEMNNAQIKVTVDQKITDHIKNKVAQFISKIFSLDLDLKPFYIMAENDAHLKQIVNRFMGLKPPRFPSIFETLCNAIACQLLSLDAGIQLLNNLAEKYGAKHLYNDKEFYSFPEPCNIAERSPRELRKLGFSFHKSAALIELAKIVLDQQSLIHILEKLSDEEAIKYLCSLKGIGRWSAEYTLLRGLGRIHWLPGDDIGVQRNLQHYFHLKDEMNYERVVKLAKRWDPYAGLIYFHLLLQKLRERGSI